MLFFKCEVKTFPGIRGDRVAQWLERRTRDSVTSVTRVRTPLGAQGNFVIFVPSQTCADSLSVCPTPVCIRTRKDDHVRTLKIL